jgi:diacylglycerol kinase (ATP)
MESKDKIIRSKDQGSLLSRYKKSFIHAVDGFKYYTCNEHNMIIIILATIVLAIAGFYFNINRYEWLFCITIIGCIIACELINSAIEATLDLCHSNPHPLVKIAKDAAGAAVLVLSIVSIIGAIIIFVPKFNL